MMVMMMIVTMMTASQDSPFEFGRVQNPLSPPVSSWQVRKVPAQQVEERPMSGDSLVHPCRESGTTRNCPGMLEKKFN